MVGASSNGAASRPFVWWRGEMRDLGTVAGSEDTPGRAWGLNDRGDVVGFSRTPSGTSQATLWAGPNRGRTGAAVSLGSLGEGNSFSEALAVNNRRLVVGRSFGHGSAECAFLWDTRSGMIDLGALGLRNSRATDVNERGQVVGYASDVAGFPTFGSAAEFLWEDGVLLDLNDLVPADSGWDLLAAEAVSNNGLVTGYGRVEGEIHAFLLVPADD